MAVAIALTGGCVQRCLGARLTSASETRRLVRRTPSRSSVRRSSARVSIPAHVVDDVRHLRCGRRRGAHAPDAPARTRPASSRPDQSTSLRSASCHGSIFSTGQHQQRTGAGLLEILERLPEDIFAADDVNRHLVAHGLPAGLRWAPRRRAAAAQSPAARTSVRSS